MKVANSMNIGEIFSRMESIIFEKKFESLYYYGLEICKKYSGTAVAERIDSLKLNRYTKSLCTGLTKSFLTAEKKNCQAIYFEYDLDSEWSSHFFGYRNYTSRKQNDDEWAVDWNFSIKGPRLSIFSEIYDERFDDTEEALGKTVFLIARTVCAMAEAYKQTSFLSKKIHLCIAYHDQDPVWRIHEGKVIKPVKESPVKKERLRLSSSDQIVPVFERTFENIRLPTEGLVPVQENYKWGFCNMEGDIVIQPNFFEVNTFRNGLACVRVVKSKSLKFGFVDKNGEYAIDPIFDNAQSFVNGAAPVYVNKKWGLINPKGQWVIKPSFDMLMTDPGQGAERGIFYFEKRGKKGFISSDGNILFTPLKALSMAWGFFEGLAWIAFEDKYGYIDKNGEMVIRFVRTKDHNLASPGDFHCGIAWIHLPDGMAFIDKSGRVIIDKGLQVWDFSEGYGLIAFNDERKRTAVIDVQGKIISRSGKKKWYYSDGSSETFDLEFFGDKFQEGLKTACDSHNKYITFYINTEGKIAKKIPYSGESFHDGVAPVSEKYVRYGYINRNFELMCEMDYDEASEFSNGMGIITKDKKSWLVEKTC